ncbi:GNAT family N-acetyltransferase [Streptomyces sp. NPDC058319]|uniref:GNAT family N-acetyltransferase n=1 Tax=unclassified Streptomyces TaxID=2593676 RepID=UPI0036E10F81
MPNAATSRSGSPGPVEFTALGHADLPLLHRWLSAPHVRTWWRDTLSLEEVQRKYGPRIDGTGPIHCFVIEVEGDPIGMIQGYRHADLPDGDRVGDIGVPAAAGIDYLIGDAARCGRGIGSRVIPAFSALLFRLHPDVSAIVATVPGALVGNDRGPVSDVFDTGPDQRLFRVGTTGFEPATP